MAKKKKQKDEEVARLFIDAQNIENIEQFLFICMNNIPVLSSCFSGLKCSIDRGFIPRKKELEAILVLNEMGQAMQSLGRFCQDLQKDSNVSFEELRDQMVRIHRKEAQRVEEYVSEMKDEDYSNENLLKSQPA